MSVGLKGAWKSTKGEYLKSRIKHIIWDIKDAWRRAWYGYDNVDLFDIDKRFIERYVEILKKI